MNISHQRRETVAYVLFLYPVASIPIPVDPVHGQTVVSGNPAQNYGWQIQGLAQASEVLHQEIWRVGDPPRTLFQGSWREERSITLQEQLMRLDYMGHFPGRAILHLACHAEHGFGKLLLPGLVLCCWPSETVYMDPMVADQMSCHKTSCPDL